MYLLKLVHCLTAHGFLQVYVGPGGRATPSKIIRPCAVGVSGSFGQGSHFVPVQKHRTSQFHLVFRIFEVEKLDSNPQFIFDSPSLCVVWCGYGSLLHVGEYALQCTSQRWHVLVEILPGSREVWQISLPAYLAPTPPYFPGSGKYFNQNMSPLRRTLQGVFTNMQ